MFNLITKGLFEKGNEDLYVRILLWAYEKQETGFTMEEIRPTFNLSQEEDTWVRKIFLTTSDQDRKFFEHFLNDESGTTNRHLYSLNEKGITAALNYRNIRQAERSGAWAIGIAVATAILAFITIGLNIIGLQLTRDSIQLATQPQLNFYLQREDTTDGKYIFGIENNGVVPVFGVSAGYEVANIIKKGCITTSLEVTCGGGGGGWSDVFATSTEAAPLAPMSSRTFEVLMSTSTRVIDALSVSVHYRRAADKQEYATTVVYFIDEHRIYTLDELRDIPDMAPYIASFRELTAKTDLSPDEKIYWK